MYWFGENLENEKGFLLFDGTLRNGWKLWSNEQERSKTGVGACFDKQTHEGVFPTRKVTRSKWKGFQIVFRCDARNAHLYFCK